LNSQPAAAQNVFPALDTSYRVSLKGIIMHPMAKLTAFPHLKFNSKSTLEQIISTFLQIQAERTRKQ